jgi:hypothetical protein
LIYLELEEKISDAKRAFETATSENIIELGEQYLALLEEYHRKLLAHPGSPTGNLQPGPSSSYEEVHRIKEAVRNALDQTLQEYSRVQAILGRFTEMTLHEAMETLNSHNYKGCNNWKFGEGGITDGSGNVLSLQEVVDIASLLRREEHIAQNKHLPV